MADRSAHAVNARPWRHAASRKDTLLTTAQATRTAALTNDYEYGFSDPEQYSFKSRRGLDCDVVEQISAHKEEPP
jgi:hypothetical protein